MINRNIKQFLESIEGTQEIGNSFPKKMEGKNCELLCEYVFEGLHEIYERSNSSNHYIRLWDGEERFLIVPTTFKRLTAAISFLNENEEIDFFEEGFVKEL